MATAKIVGRTFMSFKSQDGRPVEMFKYHMVMDPPSGDPNFQGQQVATCNVSMAKMDNWKMNGLFIPDIGQLCMPIFDPKGRLDCFFPDPSIYQREPPLTPAEKEAGKK